MSLAVCEDSVVGRALVVRNCCYDAGFLPTASVGEQGSLEDIKLLLGATTELGFMGAAWPSWDSPEFADPECKKGETDMIKVSIEVRSGAGPFQTAVWAERIER